MKETIDKIDNYFNPDSPVRDSKKLYGREREVANLKIALYSRGRQALVTGPRGIGKSSLINIVSDEFMSDSDIIVRTHKCSEYDTFESIIFSLIEDTPLNENYSKLESNELDEFGGKISLKIIESGTKNQITKKQIIEKVIQKSISPSSISNYFKEKQYLFVIDEFDRLKDDECKTKLAETLRYFADFNSTSNMIIAGINLSLKSFFDNHLSNLRSTTVLEVTKISIYELEKIINTGTKALNLIFDKRLIELILWISNGIPYYVHYICKEMSIYSLLHKVSELDLTHLFAQINDLSKVGIFKLAKSSFEDAITVFPENMNDPFLLFFKDIFTTIVEREDIRKIKIDLIYSLAILPDEKQKDLSVVVDLFNKLDKDNIKYKITSDDLLSLFRFISEDSDILIIEGDHYVFKDDFHKSYIRLRAFESFFENERIKIIATSNENLHINPR